MTKSEYQKVTNIWVKLQTALTVFHSLEESDLLDLDKPMGDFPKGLRFVIDDLRISYGKTVELINSYNNQKK